MTEQIIALMMQVIAMMMQVMYMTVDSADHGYNDIGHGLGSVDHSHNDAGHVNVLIVLYMAEQIIANTVAMMMQVMD